MQNKIYNMLSNCDYHPRCQEYSMYLKLIAVEFTEKTRGMRINT